MIDKSIRQHYREGKEVGSFKKGKDIIMSALPQVKKITPTSIAKSAIQRGITKKLAGTGLLSSLGPIGALLAMFLARKGVDYASGKIPKDVGQAFTSGIAGLGVGSPQAGRELRQLESRRANMLQRKEEGRNYSEKNLDMVTRAIAEAKGLDINNPNEMRNIDKPITQIQIQKSITEPSQIIPEEPEVKSPFAKVIPKTPKVIIPHLEGDDIIPTPTLPTDFAFEDAKRVAQEKAEQERQAAEEQRATQLAAEVAAAAAKRNIQQHTGNGGGGSGQAASRAGGGSQQAQSGGASPSGGWGGGWGWAKGGRVDKALGGRSRDIG